MKKITLILMGMTSILLTLPLQAIDNAKITVKVIDENNLPINQANVSIGFRHIRSKKPGMGWGNKVDYHPAKGETDENGIFSASDSTSPNVVVSVNKEGYYNSATGVSFDADGQVKQDVVKIILKKKRNPIPMYAKRTEAMKIPVLNQPIGYDLEVGDWVEPHGKGKISDFSFTFKSNVNNRKDFDCSYTLSFSNPNDGIIEYEHLKTDKSSYKWPFLAPISGYKKTLDKFISCKPKEFIKTNLKKNNQIKYIFRVRTETDNKGNVINAKYGKINGEISFSQNDYVDLASYYFNLNGTPNLEFDTINNLFFPKGARKQDKKYRNLIWSQ